MRPTQFFSKEYLRQCRSMKPEQIVKFLDDFRLLHGAADGAAASKSRLISLKVPERMLGAFKTKASLEGVAYQTQIKKLMSAWLLGAPAK